jgi:hypothetical protein
MTPPEPAADEPWISRPSASTRYARPVAPRPVRSRTIRSTRSRLRFAARTATRRPPPLLSNSGVATVIVGRFVSVERYEFWTVVCDEPVVKKGSFACDAPSWTSSVDRRTVPSRSRT